MIVLDDILPPQGDAVLWWSTPSTRLDPISALILCSTDSSSAANIPEILVHIDTTASKLLQICLAAIQDVNLLFHRIPLPVLYLIET